MGMGLDKTWYTPADAESKYGVPREAILKWVEDGIVRSEGTGEGLLVNIDDMELKIGELVERYLRSKK
jgi:hypothetical protein